MSDYRQRLENCGLLRVFEQARDAKTAEGMRAVLVEAQFSALEIESILWSKGDIGSAPTPEDKKTALWDAIVGRLGMAAVSGIILGGVFAYGSMGLARSRSSGTSKMDVAMSDYRSPKDAVYRPFVWGFVIGAVGALASGTLVYDPTKKNA